jgi:hypothetical protein
MRQIIIPRPIEVTDAAGKKSQFEFFNLLDALLATDVRFNSTAKGAFAAERMAKIPRSEPGSTWLVETTDGDLLREAFAEPSSGYPVRPAHLLAEMLRAVAEQKEA